MKFSEIQLHSRLQANLDRIGFTECTKIQEQAIPILRQGKDVAGLAQTGTGKTGAFLIPLIDRLLKALFPEESESSTVAFPDWKKKQYILVLVPTRELADQVYENAVQFLQGTDLKAVAVYGGTTYDKQVAALKGGVEFVIATPGRFIDLYKEHIADLALVRAIVFDEADRMFDMGFKDDMKFILKRIPRDRQFLVFSATLNFDVLNVAYEFGADPVEVNISRDQAKADNVKDYFMHAGSDEKPRLLLSLLKKYNPRQAIIFSNFKHNVEKLTKFLNANGVPAVGISSLLTQAQRLRVMQQFKAENDRNIMVATDVAARGLDILGVDMVINYELPDDAENYVHRIGRTGRAGATGQAFSLVGERDVDAHMRIEEYLKHKIENLWLDDTDLINEFKPIPQDEARGRGRFEKRSEGHRKDNRDRNRSRGRGRDQERGPRAGGNDNRPEQRAASASGGERGPRQEHRDRNSGRHQNRGRDNQQARGPRPPQQNGKGRQEQPRRQGNNGQGNRRPHHQGASRGPRPNASIKTPPPVGFGQKVTGFFKKLFGA